VYRDLYRDFDDARTPDLKFRIHTNGLLLTSKLWDSVPKIHRKISEMEVSIDAASAGTYARLRRNGHFEILLKRLAFIRSLKDGGFIPNLIFSFVVQKDNFREMPDFVALAENYGADVVNFSALFDWGTYSAAELKALQVHLPDHPEHSELLAVLRHEKMRRPVVSLGNLSDLVTSPGRKQELLLPVPV
jgi:MoaA/NifB/PqqE/SkfB family radical SAM enzyme